MIEIACAADRAFVPHTATMLASVLDNAGAEVRIHVLAAPDVGTTERELLAEAVAARGAAIEWHPVDPGMFVGLKAAGPFPAAVWYRTALAEILG
jgi:lipopolysaccharide biosynthesis glycosyltransferase